MKSPLISQLQYSEDDKARHNHYHLSCEMVFVLSGLAEFVIDGHPYQAGESSVVFINSCEQHEVRILKGTYRRYFAIVHAAELERALPGSGLAGVFKNRPAGFSHCVSLREAGGEPARIFEALLREERNPAPYGEQMVRNLLEQLLILVRRACPANFSEAEGADSSRVREVQRYIEEHFTEDIRISQLAQQFFINHCYLTHIFREQVGYSPKQYILLNRLSYAQELLERTQLQISQVAYQCGFGDANNFIRAFRNWFGLPPNQYRAQCMNGQASPPVG